MRKFYKYTEGPVEVEYDLKPGDSIGLQFIGEQEFYLIVSSITKMQNRRIITCTDQHHTVMIDNKNGIVDITVMTIDTCEEYKFVNQYHTVCLSLSKGTTEYSIDLDTLAYTKVELKFENIPVVAGDIFYKHTIGYTVLAVARDGVVFAESFNQSKNSDETPVYKSLTINPWDNTLTRALEGIYIK